MPIDTQVPGSDGWWLQRLYDQLRWQQRDAQKLWDRYEGNGPLPHMNQNQRAAVRWFLEQARTNFERLIVAAVLSRLRLRGIRTAKDNDEGGDAEAYEAWRKARGKTWSREVHKYALSMRRGYVMVGKNSRGKLLVTAEDPRLVTVISDPEDPTRAVAGLKLFYDDVHQQDVAYLFVVEDDVVRMRVARRDRRRSANALYKRFDPQVFMWSVEEFDGAEFDEPEWLQGDGDRPALCPIVEFVNEDGLAEFEPHLPLLDRITKQILDRMTIATIQAFKQRAMKGLPKTDPKTGELIDYDSIFTADPGAVWNLPASAEIWESGQVDLGPILMAVRDDIKDLAAVSGTPLYSITPDAANGSAEGASLQRETLTFKVEARQETWQTPHDRVAELIFRTTGDDQRAEPDSIEMLWAPGDRPSMSERANAIAQTKGVIPIYHQLTEIWGFDPQTADRAMTELQSDAKLQMAQAAAAKALGQPDPTQAAPGGAQPPAKTTAPLAPGQQARATG